jgi:hypothetical protein
VYLGADGALFDWEYYVASCVYYEAVCLNDIKNIHTYCMYVCIPHMYITITLLHLPPSRIINFLPCSLRHSPSILKQ